MVMERLFHLFVLLDELIHSHYQRHLELGGTRQP